MSDHTPDDAPPPAVGESTPTPVPGHGDWSPVQQLRVHEPGELIAAMPALVGFTPERSLVVVLLRRPQPSNPNSVIGPVIRFDLDQNRRRQRGLAAALASAVARICASETATEVLAVIIDDRMREPRTRGGATPWGTLVAAFGRQLARKEVTLAGAWAVSAIEAGQRWWSLLDTDHQGTLSDPTTSMVSFAYVLNGRPIHSTRSELTNLVTPDRDSTQEVTAHLEDALSAVHARYVAATRASDPESYYRRALEQVLYQIAALDSGDLPTAGQIAELAVVLRDRRVRDALLALAVGEHATAAEQLWVTLVRSLSGRDRAEAAVLLGYSAYVRGDGPLAGIALDAALETDPSHSMAILLDTALRSGMRPQELRRLADHGLGIAAELGIDLGPIHR
ncbi:DUF4192 domain-containing protein [Nocardia bhagyanarayanae]|uniref:Uncharacterized protein DUF4192 n=1 Tax=Nocardia bhagyanarayanae TaxID=1215925 RepID=A0A543FFS8_9NOCA|nr:DUF4192 domain-containing protein [Nocardia bhagyanarayanae]TQM32725.1 uncharacterized protein DUF4192 [Nocardia bhagyanarayanae]